MPYRWLYCILFSKVYISLDLFTSLSIKDGTLLLLEAFPRELFERLLLLLLCRETSEYLLRPLFFVCLSYDLLLNCLSLNSSSWTRLIEKLNSKSVLYQGKLDMWRSPSRSFTRMLDVVSPKPSNPSQSGSVSCIRSCLGCVYYSTSYRIVCNFSSEIPTPLSLTQVFKVILSCVSCGESMIIIHPPVVLYLTALLSRWNIISS